MNDQQGTRPPYRPSEQPAKRPPERQPGTAAGGGGKSTERIAAWIICLLGGVIAVWFLFRFALGILWPFVLAYLLSLCIRPLVRLAVGKSRLPRGVVAGVLVVLLIGGFFCLLTWGVQRAIAELEGLITHLSSGESGIGVTLAEVQDWLRSVSEHLPFLERFSHLHGFEAFCARLDAWVSEAADGILSQLGQWASGAVVDVVAGIPSAVLSLTVFFLSCFYFSADDGRIGRAVGSVVRRGAMRLFPSVSGASMARWRARVRHMAGQYLRAYIFLAIITFAETFLGLSLIGMPYAFLIAWVVALVDILPLFGAGAVLLPWAVVQVITGEVAQGVELLVLWAVMSVIRQVIEPRLISAGLGIHPLLSLLAMYGGWCLFGVAGMLLGPILVTVAMAVCGGEHTPSKRTGKQERSQGKR